MEHSQVLDDFAVKPGHPGKMSHFWIQLELCRHFLRGQEHAALDMSTLPNPVMDPRGDPREGTFEIPAPPPEVDDSFIKMCAENC